MNVVILMGRLTREPEIRYSAGEYQKRIARFSLAVDRRGANGESSADFISCVAFDRQAEFAEKYLHQGTKIAMTGRIQTGSYTKNDGSKVYTTDVVVSSMEFAESKASASGGSGTPSAQSGGNRQQSNEFMNVPDGEELPFN